MAQRDEDLDLDMENETPAKKGGLWKKILLFSGLGLLVVGLGVTTTLLLLDRGDGGEAQASVEEDAKSGENAKKKSKKARVGQTPFYLNLDPPFVVNLDDDSGVRFLQVSVSVMAYSETDLEKVEANMPLLRHHLVLLFSSQKFADIRTQEGKKNLQREALGSVQAALKDVTGDEVVEALYLPSIVGQ